MIEVSGLQRIPPGGVVLAPPLLRRARWVQVDGCKFPIAIGRSGAGLAVPQIRLEHLPAKVVIGF